MSCAVKDIGDKKTIPDNIEISAQREIRLTYSWGGLSGATAADHKGDFRRGPKNDTI